MLDRLRTLMSLQGLSPRTRARLGWALAPALASLAAEKRAPICAVAPETTKTRNVPGRYTRPVSIGDMPSTLWR